MNVVLLYGTFLYHRQHRRDEQSLTIITLGPSWLTLFNNNNPSLYNFIEVFVEDGHFYGGNVCILILSIELQRIVIER